MERIFRGYGIFLLLSAVFFSLVFSETGKDSLLIPLLGLLVGLPFLLYRERAPSTKRVVWIVRGFGFLLALMAAFVFFSDPDSRFFCFIFLATGLPLLIYHKRAAPHTSAVAKADD